MATRWRMARALALAAGLGAAQGCASEARLDDIDRKIDALWTECKEFERGVDAILTSPLLTAPPASPSRPVIDEGKIAAYIVNSDDRPAGAQDLWVVDSRADTPRLVIYRLDKGRLSILAARNVKYDLMIDQWPVSGPAQSPTVPEMFKVVRDAGRLGPANRGGLAPGAGKDAPAAPTGTASGH